MKQIVSITAVAFIAFCSTHMFADYTIKNNTGAPVQIYLALQSYNNISKGNKAGNAAYDFDGNLDDPKGQYRTLQPGQSAEYSWDNTDARSGIPLDKVMVKFSTDSDFSKAVPDNKIAASKDQTITLTKDSAGRAHINFEGGAALGTPDSAAPVQNVTEGRMNKSK